MSNLKVISEPWKDFGGEDTEALYLDVDRQYTISEFIALLEEAKKNGETRKFLSMTLIMIVLAVLVMYISIMDLTIEKNMEKNIMKMIRFVFLDNVR